jgi:hypothetical protein
MERVLFERQFRTPHSEGYFLKSASGDKVGRVDLHFAADVVYATMIMEVEATEEDVLDLIEQVDEDLVVTADVHRDDFLVTVYRGKDLGFYSDDYFGEDDEDEEDEEDEAEDDDEDEDEGDEHSDAEKKVGN